jgi:hypothetical protein
MMIRRQGVYRRTESGRKAWVSENSGIPPGYRKILALIDHPTPSYEVINRLPEDSEQQVWAWLDELESLCFVESSFLASGADGYEPVRRNVATADL